MILEIQKRYRKIEVKDLNLKQGIQNQNLLRRIIVQEEENFHMNSI